jgi:hypothetical protein
MLWGRTAKAFLFRVKPRFKSESWERECSTHLKDVEVLGEDRELFVGAEQIEEVCVSGGIDVNSSGQTDASVGAIAVLRNLTNALGHGCRCIE